MKKIEVVAAVIYSPCGNNIFLAKRFKDAHQGDLWEFPGGKKERGESPIEALKRELQEELGIDALTITNLIKLSHDYGDKQIELDVYKVTKFDGEPHGAEGQITQWVAKSDLNNYDFPAANEAILDMLW